MGLIGSVGSGASGHELVLGMVGSWHGSPKGLQMLILHLPNAATLGFWLVLWP